MNTFNRCEGIAVPMITPFDHDGNIDLMSARRITRYLINHGAAPFILGTTGEASSVSMLLRGKFVQAVAEEAGGKVPVYVGISSNCYADTIQMASDSAGCGATFLVAHLPSYYPLRDLHMEDYFLKLADSVPLPLLLYNILATTHISIPFDVVCRLSEHPNIIGIKDSEQDYERQLKIIEFCKTREGFNHLIGWGARCKDALMNGSNGMVPSTGNFAPGIYNALYRAVKEGDEASAGHFQKLAGDLSAIYQKGRILSESLAALKVIMYHMKLCETYVAPPLMHLPDQTVREIQNQLAEMNVEQLLSEGKEYLL
jgi:dihydrodipicolinate synthase/N-acetylneuraminate lyase